MQQRFLLCKHCIFQRFECYSLEPEPSVLKAGNDTIAPLILVFRNMLKACYSQNVTVSMKFRKRTKINDDAAVRATFDLCKCTQTNMTTAKKKTANTFDSFKYKHHFKNLSLKSSNVVACCILRARKKSFSNVRVYFFN